MRNDQSGYHNADLVVVVRGFLKLVDRALTLGMGHHLDFHNLPLLFRDMSLGRRCLLIRDV